MRRVENTWSSVGSSLTRIGAGLSLSITAPLALLGKEIADVGIGYQRAMNMMQATTGATGQQMARAAKLAEQLGADMQLPATSAADAALAMQALAAKGFSAEQSMQAVRGVLQLAASAHIEEAQAAEITASAINAFGLAASESERVVDLLAAASVRGGSSIEDMSIALRQSAATAHSLKIPIEDTVTVLSLMARAGIQGSDAGTSLKTALIHLVPATREAQEEMKRLHLEVFDGQGKLLSMGEIIGQLSSKTSKLTDAQKLAAIQTIFGTDAQRAANIMAETGVEKYTALRDALTKGGAAAELAAAQTQGLGGALDGLKSQLETVALKIYEAVAPGLESIIRAIADVIGALAHLDPQVIRAGATIAAVFGIGGPVVLAIGGVISLLGGPLTLAIVGVIGMSAALAGQWVLHGGQMADSNKSLRDSIEQLVGRSARALGVLLDAFGTFGNLLATILGAIGSALLTALSPLILFGGLIAGEFSRTLNWLETSLDSMLNFTAESFSNMTRNIRGEWTGMLQDMVSKGFDATDDFAAVGEANGSAYSRALASAMSGTSIEREASGRITKTTRTLVDGILTTQQEVIREAVKGFEEAQGPPIKLSEAQLEAELRGEAVRVGEKGAKAFAPAGAKVGHSFSRALLNSFEEGIKGFDAAVSLLESKAARLGDLFGPLSAKAKAGAEKLRDALKVVTGGVNDYLQAMGVTGRVTEEQFARMIASGNTSLAQLAQSWKHTEENVHNAGIELASASINLNTINELLEAHGVKLRIDDDLLRRLLDGQEKLSASDRALIADLDVLAKEYDDVRTAEARHQLEMARGAIATEQLKVSVGRLLGFFSPVKDALSSLGSMFAALGKNIMSAAEITEHWLGRLKTSFQNLFSLQKLNLRTGITDTILSELRTLADASGQELDKVVEQFRAALVEKLPSVTGEARTRLEQQIAEIDQVLLNSQLTKLEEVWGRPLGRAIQALLDHFDKLRIGVARKITAIGELLSALPDKLGGRTLNKWINTINQWINFAQKLLTVLTEVFGVKLPGSVQKVLDILTNGGQSTTKIMKEMKDEVVRIMKEMADEVVALFKEMVAQAKGEMGKMKDQSATASGQIKTNFVGGMRGLPDLLGQIFGSVTGIFERMAQIVIGVTRNMGAQVGVIYNLIGNGALLMGNQVAIGMQHAASATSQATQQMQTNAQGWQKAANIFSAAAAVFAGIFGAAGHTRVAGALGGAAAGAQIGTMIAPGVGTVIGALGGALLGGIFGGKSALQKAQEAAALQQAKDAIKLSQQSVLQAIEATKQSIIETVSKIRDLLESIRFYTKLPEGVIDAFFQDLNKFAKRLARAMEKWKSLFVADMKEAAETFKSGVEAIAGLPSLFAQLASRLKLDDSRIEAFFVDVEKFVTRFGDFIASIPKRLQTRIRKFSEKIGDGLDILSPLIEALKSMTDLRSVPQLSFDILESALNTIIERMGKVAENFGKGLQKSIGFFAQTIAPAVELWKASVETIRSMVDLPAPTEADFENLFKSLETGLNKSIELASRVVEETLPRTVAIWEGLRSIYESLKSGIEFVRAIVEIPMPSEESFSNLFSSLHFGLERALTFASDVTESTLALAVATWDKLRSIFESVKSGVETARAVAEAKWPDDAAWDGFVGAVKQMTSALATALEEALKGRELSAQFLTATRETKDNVLEGLANLSAAVQAASGFTRTASISLSTAGADLSSTTSAGAGATSTEARQSAVVAGLGAPATSSPTQVIYQYDLQIDARGAVIDQVRLRDYLLAALVDLEKTNRVKLTR